MLKLIDPNPKLNFELQRTDNLLHIFEVIHNYIYVNDGLSPQQTLEEVIRVLFVKIADEILASKQFFVADEEKAAMNQGVLPESFLERLNRLFQQTKVNFREVFDADEKIRLSPNALAHTVDKLQSLSLTDSCNDAKGLAFQKFLANHEKGESGQFFTPPPIVDFCVEMLRPQPDELIIDPACGSGGFLLSSLRSLKRYFPDCSAREIIGRNLYGFDINKSIAKIARMQLLLETDGQVNIFCANSLLSKDHLLGLIGKKHEFEGFDIVLANPPFGTTGKITNAKILSQFDFGYKWLPSETGFYKSDKLLSGQVAEVLYVERCLSLLRAGGRMAVILPNGHFENSSLEFLRQYVKQNAKILAIVNLPQETFIPYGTGVKTSILFLERNTASLHKPYKVFFSRINKLGYQGNKNASPLYKKDNLGLSLKDESNQPILDEDFSLVVADYEAFKLNALRQTEQSFILPSSAINGRFNYDYHLPRNRDLVEHLKSVGAVKLSEIAEIVKTKSKKLAKVDEAVEYIELSDVNAQTFEIINSTSYRVYDLPSRATYELRKGDIITSVAGNSVGSKKHATALVGSEHHGHICTNGFRILRNLEIDQHYLLFYLRSELFLRQVFMYRTGATIPSLSDSDFASILVYIPPKKQLEDISQEMRNAFKLKDISRNAMQRLYTDFLNVT